MSPTHHERLDVLDGLRGIAIGLVVWYHAWLVYGWYAGAVNFLAEAGFLGVDLFFFISGFCLFVPYARSASAGRPAPGTARFFARRAVKIVPSYLLALVAFSVAYRTHFVSPEDAFVAIVSHLTFVHTLSPATYGAISGPLWTVGIEVQFYLLFPFIAFWFSRAPLLIYAALAVISETYRATIGGLGLGATFTWINQLPAYLDLFAAGMLGAYAFVALGPRARQIDSRIWTIASIVLFGVVLAGAWGVSALGRATNISEVYTTVNMYRFLIGPVCLALALATSFAVARWRRCITARPLVFLSVISYNLYLWNLEVGVWLHNVDVPRWLAFSLAIASGVALATAVTYVFERPILEADLPAVWATLMRRLRAVTATADLWFRAEFSRRSLACVEIIEGEYERLRDL